MALKIHIMGPRSNKFPYKAVDSFFIKLNNKTHNYILNESISSNLSIEDTILSLLKEGIELMKKERE